MLPLTTKNDGESRRNFFTREVRRITTLVAHLPCQTVANYFIDKISTLKRAVAITLGSLTPVSYLLNRTQVVKMRNTISTSSHLASGVPQGSVLGPILFSAYISPIGKLAADYKLNHQQYADDTQLFISFSPSNPTPFVSQLEEIASLCVAGTDVTLSNKIKTLGVTLDSCLSLNDHVSAVCGSCLYHIKALRHIRASLTTDVSITLATALVQSRLDYANSILYNTTTANLHKLQRIQNTLAKAIFPSYFRISASELLHNLHWLPINKRIDFKIAVITYKLLAQNQPTYLRNLLTFRESNRSSRSAHQNYLYQPRTKTEFGARAFSSAAPKIWNSLPLDLRLSPSIESFRSNLKTYYFTSV
jgi:hypothetical protein